MLFPIQFKKLENLLNEIDSNSLLVVWRISSRAEICRIANIVWGKINRFSSKKKTNILNFCYATPPRFGFKWFEDIIDQKVYDTVDCFINCVKFMFKFIKE